MSFILDALRKSEHQRQRHIGPSLADAPVRRRSEDRPWWALALVALLVANLGVLMVMLMRDGKNTDAQAAAVRAPAMPVVEQAASPPQTEVPARNEAAPPVYQERQATPATQSRDAEVRSLSGEASSEYRPDSSEFGPPMNPALAAAANVPAGPPRVRPIEPPAVAPLPSQPAPGTVVYEEAVPDVTEVTLNGTNVPEMHLDIHVYSNNPADRFVYINMRKYAEGDTLQEGPSIEHIRADGVVLNQRGTRFLLPRR